jgi:hypothetical protein
MRRSGPNIEEAVNGFVGLVFFVFIWLCLLKFFYHAMRDAIRSAIDFTERVASIFCTALIIATVIVCLAILAAFLEQLQHNNGW